MSKFADRLRSLSRSGAPRIGFHIVASESKSSSLLLVAGLPGTQAAEAKVAASADAGLLMDQIPDVKTFKKMTDTAGDVPLGVLVRGGDTDKANKLVASGCDFLVFDTKAAAAVMGSEQAGKFLVLEPSLDLGMARAVNSLELDGVFVRIEEGQPFVALEHLLACRRFVDLLEKPVMLILPSPVTQAELAMLWQLGIDGVLALPPHSAGSLTDLKKMIEAIPGGRRGRKTRAGAMLPFSGGAVSAEDDDEDDDDVYP